jgi:hypothetical protein
MGSLRMRTIAWPGLIGIVLLTVGCTSSTRVTFDGPPGSVLSVDNKPYHLPAQVELTRPAAASGSKRHDVSLVTTVQSTELRAKGHIDVFGYNESDVDKHVVNTCNLDEPHLAQILGGTVVIFKGQSASRQPLYDLTLAKN